MFLGNQMQQQNIALLKDFSLKLYQFSSRILLTKSFDNDIFGQVLDIISEVLGSHTTGLFIWDEDINLYYPLALNGRDAAKLKTCFDDYFKGKDSVAQFAVFNVFTENFDKPIELNRCCQFISIYSGKQCLGILGFLSENDCVVKNVTEFFTSIAHFFSCIDLLRERLTLEQKSRELVKVGQRLEQVLHHNMDKQAVIEKMAADLKKQAEEARKANKAKSEFLSSMSHELRTPLNGILGFAQLLELEADSLNSDQKENVGHIVSSSHHLLALINQLLDLAKIESGKLELNFEYFSIQEVIRNCVETTRALADKKQIKVINMSKNYHCEDVYSDKMRVKQILLNLLSNAIKYNREAGNITIECDNVVANHFLRIKVIDTGMGLSKEQMTQVFDPFERLNFEQSTIEGTGIGLNICKLLIHQLGGKIGVESEVGSGSCFWIELALNNSPENVQLLTN